MKGNLLKAAKERLAYLKELLGRIKEAQEQVPDIQEIVERTEWEIGLLSDLPEGGEEFIPPGLISSYSMGNEHLQKNYPLPPKYFVEATNSTASITTSGSTDMYSIVSRSSEIETIDFQEFSGMYIPAYRQMQEKQSRFEKIREFLTKLNPERITEFESARESYSAAIADVGKREAAGISMRNVLEHFKGDLFQLARKHEKENMTWERMSERLAKDGGGSVEHSELMKQKAEWSSLQSRLSDVAKGQKKGLVADLDDIWTKLLDHMFTVLGIIQLE